MVSAVNGTSLAQTMLARADSRKAQEAVAATPALATEDAGTAAAAVPSAQTQATARVGDELDAQFDASRVRQAQEDEAAVDGSASEAADASIAAPAAGAAGGARMDGRASGSSESASTDYIAEADTNNDRKVSEQERIAYAKKQASEAEKKADMPQRSREEEVQQAYLPREASGSQLDVSA